MTKPDLLAARYGKTASTGKLNRRNIIALGEVLLVAFLAWAIWVAATGANQIKSQDVGYEVFSPNQTSVRFKVESPAGPAVCAIQVLNQSFTVVGYKEVPIPASGQYETFVNTTELGVSGLVDKCWLK